MEAESSGPGKKENLTDEMFNSLKELLGEIDKSETADQVLPTETPPTNPEIIPKNMPNEFSKESKNETRDESKQSVATNMESSEAFDEYLVNLCESIEKDDAFNRSLKNSEELDEKDNPVEEEFAEVSSKDQEIEQKENNQSCETVANNVSLASVETSEPLESPKEISEENVNLKTASTELSTLLCAEKMEISDADDSAKVLEPETSEPDSTVERPTSERSADIGELNPVRNSNSLAQ